MYVVVYYIVFAMRNESTMADNKTNEILNYCFHCNVRSNSICWFDHLVVRLAYSDIDLDIVTLYLELSTVKMIRWHSRLELKSSKSNLYRF